MAVISRVATILYNNNIGSTRTFQAIAATQDNAAGSSVVVTITQVAAGAVPPGTPDTFTLDYVNDSGSVIKSVALNITSASQTDSFFFTDTGLTGGSNRAGTVEIRLRVTKTTGGPAATYDTRSDGAPNTPPSTFTSTQLDRGWIRGTTTAVQVVSNLSLGGSKSAPAKYNESLFVRTTLGAATYVSRVLTATVSGATAGLISSNSASGTGPVFDSTFANIIHNQFPAAVTNSVTGVTVPNATLTGLPATVLTVTTDNINVDPRFTATHLLQINQSAFAVPPMSFNTASGQRQQSDLAYLSTNIRDSRGTLVGNVITGGVNGITANSVLASVIDSTINTTQTAGVTATQGGEAGWLPLFTWSNGLPGGIWNKTVTITSPANATGAGYLQNSSIAYTLIAKNPNYDARSNVNHVAALAGRHYVAGMDITVVGYVLDFATQKRVAGGLITSAICAFVRPSPTDTAGTSNTFQFLNSAGVWTTWVPGMAQETFTLTASTIDADTFERRFTTDATWGLRDFRASIQFVIGGVTYASSIVVINVDGKNQHDVQDFDPTGLFK